MYIRTKKIKDQHYVYLVSARWSKRKKAPKQKTIKYLGKLKTIKKITNKTFEQYIKKDIDTYLKKTQLKKLILDLIRCELINHKFKEVKKDIWQLSEVIVDLKTKRVYNPDTGKTICLELNNNFLTTHTLRNIINFNSPPNLTNMQVGKSLAKAFLSAGILLPEPIFLAIYQKISKKI